MTLASLQLRPAVASDLGAILALERTTDKAPHWTPAAYAAIVEDHDSHRCLVLAEHDRALAGFAVALARLAPDDTVGCIAELESVVVAADARRVGIGRALCEAVCDWCRSQGAAEIVLEVRAASAGAIALYSGLGFEQTGRRPRYYRHPEDDAVVMRLRLGPPPGRK